MLAASIRKEILLLLRDRGALASMFVLPVAFMAFFGFMFRGGGGGGGDGEARELAVWHAAGDARAARVVGAIERSRQFRISREDTPERVRARVADEELLFGVVFPEGFDPDAGTPAELVVDETLSPRIRAPVEGALGALAARALHPELEPALNARYFEARTPPGIAAPLPGMSGFQVSVPGNAVLFCFFIAVTVGISFVEDRRTGVWRRLLAAPVRRPALLIAKLVPFFVVAVLQMAFLFGIGIAAFGLRVGGSWPALIAVTLAVAYCAVALGLLIASFGGTEKQVGGFASVVILVMGMVGGAMIPRIVLPGAMQTMGLAVPHGWAIEAYGELLLRGGAGLADVAPHLGVLLAFGTAFAAFGAARFKFA